MILIVIGDDVAAGGGIKSKYNWAIDDHYEIHHGNRAHPANIPFAFGFKTAKLMHCGFHSLVSKDATVSNYIDQIELIRNKNNDLIVLASWNKTHIGERKKIEQYADYLETIKIPAAFVNSDYCFESQNPVWIWNTAKQNIKNWAKDNNFLTAYLNLTSQGHSKLANLMLLHLTKFLPNLIIEE